MLLSWSLLGRRAGAESPHTVSRTANARGARSRFCVSTWGCVHAQDCGSCLICVSICACTRCTWPRTLHGLQGGFFKKHRDYLSTTSNVIEE